MRNLNSATSCNCFVDIRFTGCQDALRSVGVRLHETHPIYPMFTMFTVVD